MNFGIVLMKNYEQIIWFLKATLFGKTILKNLKMKNCFFEFV